jgi:hypothetical protein
MTTICINYDSEISTNIIRNRLDTIADRIPCIVKYHADTCEISVQCRTEDAPWVERMLADLV